MGVHEGGAYPKVKELLGIPKDEPVFILRAQDKLSMPMLARYENMARQIEDGPSQEWFMNLGAVMHTFNDWQHENKTKVPD